MILRGRQDVGISVPGAPGRGVDDPLHPGATARLQQPDRAQHVDARVEERIDDRAGDRGLGRDVNDDARLRRGEHGVEPGLAQVADVQSRRGGDSLAPARGQIVDHVDRVALREETIDDVRADEAGAARDQNLHARSSSRNQ